MNINKEKILDVALETYIKNGIRRVSSLELAQKLGISTKTLYESIGTRDLLLNAVVHEFLTRIKSGALNAYTRGENPIERLTALFVFILQTFKGVNPSFIYELKKRYKDCYQEMLDFGANDLSVLAVEIINEGISQGLIRNDIPVSELYNSLLEKIVWIVEQHEGWSTANGKHTGIVLLVNGIRGMTTLKGHQLLDENVGHILNQVNINHK